MLGRRNISELLGSVQASHFHAARENQLSILSHGLGEAASDWRNPFPPWRQPSRPHVDVAEENYEGFCAPIDQPFTVRGTEIRPDDTPEQYRQKLLRITLDEMVQVTGLLSTDGVVLECNRSALDYGNLTQDSIIGKPLWDTLWWTVTSQTPQELRGAIGRAAQGESVRYEVEVNAENGAKGPTAIDFTPRPVRDDRGTTRH